MKRNVTTLLIALALSISANYASAQVTKHTGNTVPVQSPNTQYVPYTPAPVPAYNPPVYAPSQGETQAQYDAQRQQIDAQIAQIRAQEQQLRQQEKALRAQEAALAQSENNAYGTNYGSNYNQSDAPRHDHGKHKGWEKNGKAADQNNDGD